MDLNYIIRKDKRGFRRTTNNHFFSFKRGYSIHTKLSIGRLNPLIIILFVISFDELRLMSNEIRKTSLLY
jgi:hypothetical protein